MHRGNRVFDLLLLIVLIGGGAFYYFQKNAPKSLPAPVTTATANQQSGPAAAFFTLPKLPEGELVFKGKGPALITLSAIGCDGCMKRVPLDRQAYELAHARGVPVWNILVFADAQSGQAFIDKFKPQADEFLYENPPIVSVNTYGGSDNTCWMVIDKSGSLVYKGAADLKALESKLP